MRGRVSYMIAGVVGAVAAVLALLDAGGNAFRDDDPRTALIFDSGNEMVHQAMADSVLERGVDPVNLADARPHTLLALAGAPGLGHMLRSYALLAETGLVKGDPVRVMTAASQFSKRDLATQLWLIDNLARSGDIDATIRKYDDALRTNRSISGLLYPMLARAVADDELRPAIVKLMRSKPDWDSDFYFHMASSPKLAVYMPQLLDALGKDADDVPPGTREMAAQTLFRIGRIGLSERIAVPRNAARNIGDFNNDEGRVLPPFAWKFRPMGTVSASPQDDGSLAIDIGSGAGGMVAERVISLNGGRVGMEGLVSSKQSDPDRLPWLKLECASGREGSINIRPVPIETGLFRYSDSGTLAGCRFADLRVIAPSNFSGGLVRAEIKSLRLTTPSAQANADDADSTRDEPSTGDEEIVIPPLPGEEEE